MKLIIIAIILFSFSCENKINPANQERIKTNLSYLASDDLKGRGTGTEGEKSAAEFIKTQFSSAGLEPFKEQFDVPFDYEGEVELGEENKFAINSVELELYKDFEVLSFSKSGKFEKNMAEFVGYGIQAEKYNSYRKANVKGRVVFVLDGYPETANSHSDIAMKSNRREKARVAREAGAVAIVFLVDQVAGDLQNRHVNTDAGIVTVSLLTSTFKQQFKINESVFKKVEKNLQNYTLRLNVSLTIQINRLQKQPNNIVAMKSGSKSDEYIIFGAHYDHLGVGYQTGGYKENSGKIHNGADDNASGTTGLIELAHMLKSYRSNYTVLFMAFSGEELGLLGSKALMEQKIVDPAKVKLMINMDMIGRLDPTDKAVTIFGSGTAAEFDTILVQIGSKHQLELKKVAHSPGNSDHASFYREKIPVLFFNTALHSDYHKPTDDSDLINYAGEASVLNFISDVYQSVDDKNQSISYVEVSEPAQRRVAAFKVYIGTHPDYAYQGKGLKITGMSPDSPAEKAGMKKNDILVEMSGKKIENIYDYMGVLGGLEPDIEIPIKVKRDDKIVELKMTPTAKK